MTRFALPLFELVGQTVIPCLRTYQKICKENLEIWQARKARFASECTDREERQTELNRLKPRPPNEYRGIFKLCIPNGFCSILPPLASPPPPRPLTRPSRAIGGPSSSRTSSDSQSDSISISTVSSTVLSTPTSPLSPSPSLPDSCFEFTPPSSPTTTTSSSTSDTFWKGNIGTETVGRKKGRGGVVQLPQPHSHPQLHLPVQAGKTSKERMGLRIGTDSSPNNVNGNGTVHSNIPNANGAPKYRYGSWRKANGGGGGSSPGDQTQSPSSSTTSASATSQLFSPFTPFTSTPSTASLSPSTSALSPESSPSKSNGTGKPSGIPTMNYRRALTKTPSLAKMNSACRSLSSPRSVNSLRGGGGGASSSSSLSSPSKYTSSPVGGGGSGSSPKGEKKSGAAEKTTTPTTIVVSPPSRRGVLGGYRTTGGRS